MNLTSGEERLEGCGCRKAISSATTYLRLDRESRRMRFGMAVNDDFIGDYASRIGDMKGLVYGYFADGEMRAAAEMRLIGDCLALGCRRGVLG